MYTANIVITNPLHGVESVASEPCDTPACLNRIRYMELKEETGRRDEHEHTGARNPLHGVESVAGTTGSRNCNLGRRMNPLHGVER